MIFWTKIIPTPRGCITALSCNSMVKCPNSNICLSNFKIFHLWVCSEIYDKALPSRHYPLTWPVMNVVFNVAGHERPFQLCISGVAPLRGPRICRSLNSMTSELSKTVSHVPLQTLDKYLFHL